MTTSYRWMRDLLDLMYQNIDQAAGIRMLRDQTARDEMLRSDDALHGFRAKLTSVDAQEFDNLLVALLALRLRFDRDTAFEKVELNIAMREGRR